MNDATTAPGESSPRRRHRWWRRLAWGLGGLLGALLLALACVYGYLSTERGGERLRARVVKQANAALSGTVELGRLELHGTRVVARGLVLRDPDGEVVAKADQVEAKLALGPLAKRTITLRDVRLVRPELRWIEGSDGVGLMRALAPRHPKPPRPEEPAQPSSLRLAVEGFALEDGALTYRTPARRAELVGLNAEGSGRLTPEALAATLRARAELTEPLTGPVVGDVELAGTASSADAGASTHREGTLSLDLAGAVVRVRAAIDGAAEAPLRAGTVTIERLELPPEVARAVVPTYRLQVPLVLSGDAAKDGDRVSTRLLLEAGAGSVKVEGAGDLARLRAERLTVVGDGIDLSELVENGPASAIAFDLEGEGGGRSLETAEGRLRLRAPQTQIGAERLGPIRLDASARDGQVTLHCLEAKLPGLALEGQGHASRAALGGQLRADATDLAALGRTLGTLVRPRGLPLTGKGQLVVELSGTPEHPGIAAHAQVPALSYQENAVKGLELRAKVPDVRSPRGAHVELDAQQVAAAGRRFTRAHLALESTGNALTLDVAVRNGSALTLHVGGEIDPDDRGGRLSAFTLWTPKARWTLQRPARIGARPRHFFVEKIDLRAGEQRLTLDAELRDDERVRATVQAKALDLGLLPELLVPTTLALAGKLDLDVHAEGLLRRPELTAKVQLRDGKVKQYGGLGLSLDGRFVGERARGSLWATAEGMRLDAKFDVPVRALRERRRQPVELNATLREFDLHDALKRLGSERPLAGKISAQLKVEGMANDPRLTAELHARGLQLERVPAADVELAVRSDKAGKLGAELLATLLDDKSTVRVTTPFTLGGLIASPPTAEALRKAPVTLDADLDELPLPLLYTAGLIERSLLGTLSGKVELRGPVSAPLGTATIALRGFSVGKAEPTDVRAELIAEAQSVRAELEVAQKEGRMAQARASLGTSLGALIGQGLAALRQRPLSVHATVGPVPIANLQAFAHDEAAILISGGEEVLPPFKGILAGELDATGTLANPTLTAHALVKGLGVDPKSTGDVELRYGYARTKHDLSLHLASAGGGDLQLQARSTLDLGDPSAFALPQLRRAPLEGTLRAQALDLAFLSGVTSRVKTLGGKLDADVRVGGMLVEPKPDGSLEWKDGLLAIRGNGSYREIHLKTKGDVSRLALEELAVKGGKGKALVHGLLERKGDGYTLSLDGNLEKFPIITESQLLASVSLRLEVAGEGNPDRLTLGKVKIPEAHVELPDVKRRDAQPLEVPKDIVLVRNGRPLVKKQAEAAQARAAPRPPRTGRGEGQGSGTGGSGRPNRPGRFTIEAVVDAPRNLWIHSADVNVEIGLSDKLRVEYTNRPLLFGEVKVLRGRVGVLGRDFDLVRDSVARFHGPPTNPDLRAAATYRNDPEGVTVTLQVEGSREKLTITPSSEPPLPESQIYTLLATGHTQLREGSGTSSPAAAASSVLGSLLATQLKKTLSDKLPLDVLSIEAGDQKLGDVKLRAGTYVNDKLYIGFTGHTVPDPYKGENANEVNLEYQLSKRWSAQGRYGDARAGGLGLFWTKEY